MKTAFVFPGQGSQSIGMGRDLFDQFPAARLVFEEVDDALHENLSGLMFSGDVAELTKTENAQPAIMTVGMAAVRALESELGHLLTDNAVCVAGHSLGEYTALCAAGVFSVSDAARLLRARGRAMAAAGHAAPGAMAAVLGLTMDQVQTLVEAASTTEARVVVANDNCPGQVVISGHTEAIDRAIAAATAAGAKRALKLQVAGAFHSPYMQPAADEMKTVLSEADFNNPRVPVVANVTAAFETTVDEIKRNLVDQITGSVRWTESTALMTAQGVDTFIECGNGKVITGLMKRMAPQATLLSVGDKTGIESALSLLK